MCHCLSEKEPLCTEQVTVSFLCSECVEQELVFQLLLAQGEHRAAAVGPVGGSVCQPSGWLQVGSRSGGKRLRCLSHPQLNLAPHVCSLFLGCVMQVQSPVILQLKICPLQENYRTVVVLQFQPGYVDMLGSLLGLGKRCTTRYCYFVWWGFLVLFFF